VEARVLPDLESLRLRLSAGREPDLVGARNNGRSSHVPRPHDQARKCCSIRIMQIPDEAIQPGLAGNTLGAGPPARSFLLIFTLARSLGGSCHLFARIFPDELSRVVQKLQCHLALRLFLEGIIHHRSSRRALSQRSVWRKAETAAQGPK